MNTNNKDIEIHIETDEEYGRRVSGILETQQAIEEAPDYLQDVLRAIIYPKDFPKFGELTEGEPDNDR